MLQLRLVALTVLHLDLRLRLLAVVRRLLLVLRLYHPPVLLPLLGSRPRTYISSRVFGGFSNGLIRSSAGSAPSSSASGSAGSGATSSSSSSSASPTGGSSNNGALGNTAVMGAVGFVGAVVAAIMA